MIPFEEIRNFIQSEILHAGGGVLLDCFFVILQDRGRPSYSQYRRAWLRYSIHQQLNLFSAANLTPSPVNLQAAGELETPRPHKRSSHVPSNKTRHRARPKNPRVHPRPGIPDLGRGPDLDRLCAGVVPGLVKNGRGISQGQMRSLRKIKKPGVSQSQALRETQAHML
jgi:hypothetical protein